MIFERVARTRILKLLALAIAVLAVVEIASFVLLDLVAIRDRGVPIPSRAMAAYRDVPWAAEYWREQKLQEVHGYELQEYGLVRAKPFAGATIVVDSAGLRRTADSRCEGPARTVYVFGSSMVWGYGAPDWETIPSYLAKRYAADGRPACVINFGSNAWRVNHGVVKLVQELRKPGARRPDVVVFINGANEVFTPFFYTGRVDREAEWFESAQWTGETNPRRAGSVRYVTITNTAILAQRLLRRFEDARIRRLPPDSERLARQVAENYVRNIQMVDGLANAFGFRYAFFWEPLSLAGQKALTADERQGIEAGFGSAFPDARAAVEVTLPQVRAAAAGRFHDLSGMFDGHPGSVYVDFCHLLPAGNRLVADRIYEVIR